MKLKVVCLNVWIGGVLHDDIIEFLRAQDADIIALQEVLQSDDKKLPIQFRTLDSLEQLGYPYRHFAPASLDRFPWGDIPCGNTVLSKLPITGHNVTFFDKTFDPTAPRMALDPATYPVIPRNLQHVVLDAGGTELNLFNFQGVWDLDGDNVSPQRQKMSDTILHKTAGKQHVIVTGDTNARYTNPVMRKIEARLTNVFGDTLTTTFNMRRKSNPGYATSVVDLMYVSEDFTIINKDCPDVDVSDHLPLVVELEL